MALVAPVRQGPIVYAIGAAEAERVNGSVRIQERESAELIVVIERVDDDKVAAALHGCLLAAEREYVWDRTIMLAILTPHEGFGRQQIHDAKVLCLRFQQSGMRGQVLRAGVASVPTKRPRVDPAFEVEPQCELRGANPDLFPERDVFKPLEYLHRQGPRRQANLTSAIDVGVFARTKLDIAADIHAYFGGELGEPSERSEVQTLGIAKVNAHRRRLFCGRVVYSDVNGVHCGVPGVQSRPAQRSMLLPGMEHAYALGSCLMTEADGYFSRLLQLPLVRRAGNIHILN
jgi:hypothetical protein